MLPLRYIDNYLVISNEDKANFLSTYLEENFQPHPNINDIEHSLNIENIKNQTLPMSFSAKPTSPSEIKFIINKLPKKKKNSRT